jgi:hypothetical protein
MAHKTCEMTLFLTKGTPESQTARQTLASIVVELDPYLLSFETRDLGTELGVLGGVEGQVALRILRAGHEPLLLTTELASRGATLAALQKAGIALPGASIVGRP